MDQSGRWNQKENSWEGRDPKRKWNAVKTEIIALGFLMAFAFFINRGIQIKGLYMDDLYLWSCYGEQSFFQYVFPLGGTRFRFLYYLASWLELAIVGNHVNWLVPVNILLNGLLAYAVFRFGRRLSSSVFMGGLCGFMYLLSRMSYYQIGQVYGLMETMALASAIGILYFLYRFYNEKEDSHSYLWASLLYFAVCFIHERYMVLLPVFFLVLLLKKKKDLALWLGTAANLGLVLVIRMAAIGTISPAGTGGTDVADTFRIKDAVKYALSQAAYVFGINAGPEHLNGLSFPDTPIYIKALVLAADAMILLILLTFLITVLRDKKNRLRHLANSLIFLAFIAMCIASSSVTVRVEMRWVYVSYTAALLWLAYLYGAVVSDLPADGKKTAGSKKRKYALGLICLLYALLMIPVEIFYRGQFPNIYLWPNQLRYNSLAEETYEKYGTAIFGKKIYMIGNTYGMSEFTADTFFKVYDKKRKAEGTEVFFVDSIRDIGQITDQMLVIREDPEHNAFQDITSFVRSLKCEPIYGYYRDGWMDEEASLRVMAGSAGVIKLELMYPGDLTGTEYCTILADGEPFRSFLLTENITYLEYESRPYETVAFEFINDYYVRDAVEQRGEKRLSMIVNIRAD